MAIQLVGAGVGRTGTHSLKLALEQLLGGTCHHMMEVGTDQGPTWHQAYSGNAPDWHTFLGDYVAIVDWPGAGLWRDLAAAFPDAPVLLSTRSSADVWFESASRTIFQAIGSARASGAQSDFIEALMNAFCSDFSDPTKVKAAYEAHNAEVRDTIDPDRLVEYQPGDGWGPLCQALGLPEPDAPFPHTNTTKQFQARRQADNQDL